MHFLTQFFTLCVFSHSPFVLPSEWRLEKSPEQVAHQKPRDKVGWSPTTSLLGNEPSQIMDMDHNSNVFF